MKNYIKSFVIGALIGLCIFLFGCKEPTLIVREKHTVSIVAFSVDNAIIKVYCSDTLAIIDLSDKIIDTLTFTVDTLSEIQIIPILRPGQSVLINSVFVDTLKINTKDGWNCRIHDEYNAEFLPDGSGRLVMLRGSMITFIKP